MLGGFFIKPFVENSEKLMIFFGVCAESSGCTSDFFFQVFKRNEAQAQLDTFSIRAPFAGVVTRVHRGKGEAVRQGDQVLELVSTQRVRDRKSVV